MISTKDYTMPYETQHLHLNFIGCMETKFDVIVLTEIGARNLSVVLNLFPN